MSVARKTLHAAHLAAIDAIAAARQDGAVLLLEAERRSLDRLRHAGAAQETLDAILLEASQLAATHLPGAAWVQTSWSRYELALTGSRGSLGDIAIALVTKLVEHPVCGRLSWRAVVTRIFPGDPRRTHCCDPGYDLAKLTGSAVVWVDPYRGDDWMESQRYPATTVLWQGARPG